MNTNYFCFFVASLSFSLAVYATNTKNEQVFAQIVLGLSLDEKRSEQDESDSECIKKCKTSIATTIAHLRNSLHEDEGLCHTMKLVRSEQRAKLLKEQFLQCIKECQN